MLATARRDDDERLGIVAANNDNWKISEQPFEKKKHSFDLSHAIYSIITNDFVVGVAIGAAGVGLKAAFNVAAHATGVNALIVVGAGLTGLGKAIHKAWKNDWYKDDDSKNIWWELGKSTALASFGAFAALSVPLLGDVVQNLSQNFNFGNMLAGLGGLLGLHKPEISLPATPSVQAPPTAVAPQAVLEEPVDATPDMPVDSAPPFEASAISEQWRGIEAAADAGDTQAKKDLAMALLNGVHGFEVDTDRAMELYESAAKAGNTQALRDLNFMAENDYHGTGDAARELLERYAPEPEVIVASATEIAAEPPSIAPLAGTELSMTFEIQADGSIGGEIHKAAGIIAPGTVFEIPVSQINLN